MASFAAEIIQRMGPLALLLFVLGAVGPSAAQDKKEADPKLAQFMGTWRGWAVEGKGGEQDAKPVHLELRLEGRRIVAMQLLENKQSKSLGEGVFQLAVAGKYQTIDATRTSTPGKGQTHLGIYELTGDTWRWCTGNPNKERPTEFVTRRGQFLVILKKQQPK